MLGIKPLRKALCTLKHNSVLLISISTRYFFWDVYFCIHCEESGKYHGSLEVKLCDWMHYMHQPSSK